MKKQQQNFNNLNHFIINNQQLENLLAKFTVLDQLNVLLQSILPPHLVKFCQVGSFKYEEQTVVIFIKEPSIAHLVHSFSRNILGHFAKKNFTFNRLIVIPNS